MWGPQTQSSLKRLKTSISQDDPAVVTSVANEFDLDVARGLQSDIVGFHSFSHNPDVDTQNWEMIWGPGGTYQWPTTLETIRVRAGGDVADSAGGTGARSIDITFLDTNWDVQVETLVLNGVNASLPTTIPCWRVGVLRVKDTGTYGGTNVGDITIENTTSLQALAFARIGFGRSEKSGYTVPKGFTAYIQRMQFALLADRQVSVRAMSRPHAEVMTAPYGPAVAWAHVDEIEVTQELNFTSYPRFTEKTDIWVEAIANGNDSTMTANYDLKIVRN